MARDGRLVVRDCIGGSADQWKIDFERGAAARLAVDPNVAAALFDDAVDHREAETCALAEFFCGEKRFEDANEVFGSDANAGVADGERNIASGLHSLMTRSV